MSEHQLSVLLQIQIELRAVAAIIADMEARLKRLETR
jgi:hypothetical protein